MDRINIENYQTYYLSPGFKLVLGEHTSRFHLSDEDLSEIEAFWMEEKQRKGGRLFNGEMLAYAGHDEGCLTGRFIQYKEYIATLRSPTLQAKLKVETLGASGMTFAGDSLLWGKRASFVTEFPGYYECAPSGGINPDMAAGNSIPLERPFEAELVEETGILPQQVRRISVDRLVHDRAAHLYELVATIEVDPSLAAVELPPTEEYEDLVWVPRCDLRAFVEAKMPKILPMSLYLLTPLLSRD